MGEHKVDALTDDARVRAFTRAVLSDLSALETMLETDRIESGASRFGAEQEMFLVDRDCRPAPVSDEVLRILNDSLRVDVFVAGRVRADRSSTRFRRRNWKLFCSARHGLKA